MERFILLLLFLPCFGYSQTKIILEGRYQGKNVYVQNPYSTKGDSSFCTKKVTVNGERVNVKLTSAAFVIQLDSMGFNLGDTLYVEIFHEEDCKPKILDSDNGTPRITYELVSIDSNAVLHWVSKNEIGKSLFVIEQFRWNKWVKVGEMDGKGGTEENVYSIQVVPHSGENQFRVKQSYGTTSGLSKTVYYKSKGKKVTFQHGHIHTEVVFSEETMYEVYDQEGNLLMKGTGKIIDCRKLPKSAYYLNYDNNQGEFIKS